MAEQWIEDNARHAEEIGWRVITSGAAAKDSWKCAFGPKDTSSWTIRCNGEKEYWVVCDSHHWGYDPRAQNADGPFDSFIVAAATYRLLRGG